MKKCWVEISEVSTVITNGYRMRMLGHPCYAVPCVPGMRGMLPPIFGKGSNRSKNNRVNYGEDIKN